MFTELIINNLHFQGSYILLLMLMSIVSGSIIIISIMLAFLHWRRSRHKAYPSIKSSQHNINLTNIDPKEDNDIDVDEVHRKMRTKIQDFEVINCWLSKLCYIFPAN